MDMNIYTYRALALTNDLQSYFDILLVDSKRLTMWRYLSGHHPTGRPKLDHCLQYGHCLIIQSVCVSDET